MTRSSSKPLAQQFGDLLTPNQVITDPAQLALYACDATGYSPEGASGLPAVVLLPETTAEVSAIAKHCYQHDIAMVPSGGRTGLAAGATAAAGEVVIALERMKAIDPIDKVGGTVTVEAGVITQQLQEAAAQQGLHFAIDLAAKGSSQIGGNIATNAGGLSFIRYGGMREQVLGLEVVLADGRVLPMCRSLIKDNSGYSLKQLFIGSEGTLGIITKASLKLWPTPKTKPDPRHSAQPAGTDLVLLGLTSFAAVSALLSHCRSQVLAAFEFFDSGSLRQLQVAYPDMQPPLLSGYPYYVLLEFPTTDSSEDFIESCLELEGIADGRMASSHNEYQQLWRYRELISESLSRTGFVKKNDVSVALKDLAATTAEFSRLGKAAPLGIEVLLFGHIGDGNIHINYWGDKTRLTQEQFDQLTKPLEEQVEQWINRHGGSMSAEHGIGLLKKQSLKATRSPAELEVMASLKAALDPKNLLNPGKVLGT